MKKNKGNYFCDGGLDIESLLATIFANSSFDFLQELFFIREGKGVHKSLVWILKPIVTHIIG